MKKRILFSLITFAMLLGITSASFGQSKHGATEVKGRFGDLIRAAREGKTKTDPRIAAEIRAAFAEEKTDTSFFGTFVGTWNCVVPIPDGEFYALHTFNVDGTFTETSSALATLTEGPAHGVWEHRRGGAVLTFELFGFNPDGSVAGRFRVRAYLRLTGDDEITALTTFDVIELDGTVIEDLGGGPYSATRMKVRGL